MADLLPIRNCQPIKKAKIPCLDFPVFREALLSFTASGGDIVHFFGYEEDKALRLLAVLRKGKELYAACSPAPVEYQSLAAKNEKFHLFERELAEQYGLRPLDHPWLKPVRYHANWRGTQDIFNNNYEEDIPGRYQYFQVAGDEIHEVAVGPVHAGIIEPGHFRFQCIGEKVLHLEIQLGYQHRGVEKLLTSMPAKRLPVIIEGIAGDTAIGNSLCFAQAMEALAAHEVPEAVRTMRVIALELERLANHVGDLGALSADVAYNPPAAYFGRLRGEFLNLLLVLSGNRFGKGLIRPGGITAGITQEVIKILQDKIQELRPEIIQVADLLFASHTVLARFESCGIVSRETAAQLGLVGVAGRASGLDCDTRHYLPTEDYKLLPACSHKKANGDVFSRAWVRYEEIIHSLDLITTLLRSQEAAGKITAPETALGLSADSLVVTVNEAWRGELSHCVLTDRNGKLIRYKIKDPSFHNWSGLAMALRGEGISDFPLNNKSFNLSYCGFDL